MTAPTFLAPDELWPTKLPNSFLKRVQETMAFLPDVPPRYPICDLGEPNPLKEMIAEKWHLIESIDIDLDYQRLQGQWGTILCFEVLEHLFNPLFALENMKQALVPDGRIFLSTPYQWPQILKAKHHFHEVPTDRLEWLFDRAGLRIENRGKATIAGRWYEHVTGFRPILRYFQHTRLFQLSAK